MYWRKRLSSYLSRQHHAAIHANHMAIHQYQKEILKSVPRETLHKAWSRLKPSPGAFDLDFLPRTKFQNISLVSFSLIAAAFCSPVPVPTNGAVQGYRYELGATLRISCDTGYNMVPESSSFRTCVSDGQGGGEWSQVDPVCECTFVVETLYINNSLSPFDEKICGYSSADIICSKKRTVSLSYAPGTLFASGNRYCPRTSIRAYFRVKNGGCCVYYPTTIFRGSRGFELWEYHSDIPQYSATSRA